MRVRSLALAALVVLSGCARFWAKPGGTAEAFDASRSRCETEALARYPAITEFPAAEQERIAPLPPLCGAGVKGTSCLSNGGKFVAPTLTSIGMSQPARDLFRSCMIAAGWQPVRNAEEGDAVTRGARSARVGG